MTKHNNWQTDCINRRTDYDTLPLIFDIKCIAEIMDISKVSAYQFVHSHHMVFPKRKSRDD